MKICYVCPKFYPRDVPLYEYTQRLAQLGCEVTLIAFRGEGELAQEQVDNVWVERVTTDSTARGDRFRPIFFQFLRDAQEVLKKGKWDLVNVRNLPAASAVPLWNRHKKTVWVLEIQSPPLHGGWRSAFSMARTRLDARAFHHTLVHSQAVLEDYFGHGRTNVSEIPIGVNFDHFHPGDAPELRAELGYQPQHTVFLYSGVISPKRTLHKLIEAFVLAYQQLPDLRFLFLGEGSSVPDLQHFAHEKGVGEQVTFAGHIPYPQMPEYMRVADIGLAYVPVVSWFDNAPVLKTMESLAAGLPTIATATRGNHAYIQHGQNGLLVEDNPTALAQAMVQLAQDKALQEKFRQGRQDILKYNWPDIVNKVLYPQYLRLYDQHLKK